MKHKACAVILLVFALYSSIPANDSAASTKLGGIQLRREPRIAMLKEKLTISTKKVSVEYDFLNETDHDISTEVAFPIPAYAVTFNASGIREFDDFKVWVDNHEIRYRTFAKAMLGKTDQAAILTRHGVDVASLGHFSEDDQTPASADFNKLPKGVQASLVKVGLFADDEYHFPRWTVEKTYLWRQTFPAHRILHVKHEYRPGYGFTPVQATFLDPKVRQREVVEAKKKDDPAMNEILEEAHVIDSACLDPKLVKSLIDAANQEEENTGRYVEMVWVDYILTTANSWKTPIKEFELNIEGDHPNLCWDGKINRTDASHYQAVVKDFIPKKELRIVFVEER